MGITVVFFSNYACVILFRPFLNPFAPVISTFTPPALLIVDSVLRFSFLFHHKKHISWQTVTPSIPVVPLLIVFLHVLCRTLSLLPHNHFSTSGAICDLYKHLLRSENNCFM